MGVRMEEKVRYGLVLEGGGMRGIYTAGVLDVFLDQGIRFDGVIGVSAGAIHGASFVSGQMGRSIRYYKKYCRDRHFMSWWSFFTTGDIVGRKFCYQDLPERLDPYDYNAFDKSGIEYYVGCSNVETGKPEYIRITDMRKQMDYMRASASLPYVSRIVRIDGKKLLDGGCTDSVPLTAFRKLGFSRNVVILTRPKGYVKEPENQKLAALFFHRYPAFARALKNRHLFYNQNIKEIERLEASGEAFVIRPSVTPAIGRMDHDPEKIQKTYEIGRRDALQQLTALNQWLEKEPVKK
ncbi:MAG: patatin family protein [Clostridium sp.]|nr:patatin family protein [Clostridium sp.]